MTNHEDHDPADRPAGRLYRPDDLVLSICAQLKGSLDTLTEAQRAEVVRDYCAGDVVLGLSRDGLRVIRSEELPDPDYTAGYL